MDPVNVAFLILMSYMLLFTVWMDISEAVKERIRKGKNNGAVYVVPEIPAPVRVPLPPGGSRDGESDRDRQARAATNGHPENR